MSRNRALALIAPEGWLCFLIVVVFLIGWFTLITGNESAWLFVAFIVALFFAAIGYLFLVRREAFLPHPKDGGLFIDETEELEDAERTLADSSDAIKPR